LLRFTAADVYGTPDSVVIQVRDGLAAHHPVKVGRIRDLGSSQI
jgi:hypothetical protein